MRTFAQKQSQPVQQTSVNLRRPGTSIPAAGHGMRTAMHLQSALGNHAVQRLLSANADGLEVDPGATPPSGAAQGSGRYEHLSEFPHYAALEHAFGTPFKASAIAAPELCRTLGAPAFTFGDIAIFSSKDPPLEVAAHEATHVAQHNGVTWDLGLGPEGHAATVAQAIQAGASVRALLAQRGAQVRPALRPYTVVKAKDQRPGHYDVGKTLRVSLGMAVVDQSQDCWAMNWVIERSNSILTSQKSPVTMKKTGEQLAGNYPPLPGEEPPYQVDKDNKPFLPVTLHKVKPSVAKLPGDCGQAACTIMGTDPKSVGAYYVEPGTGYDMTTAEKPTKGKYVETNRPQAMALEVYRRHFRPNDDDKAAKFQAYNDYKNLSPEKRKEFDQKNKLNEYARPEVGEAYVITDPDSTSKYPHHWGAVVLTDGGPNAKAENRVTLENFRTEPPEANDKWWFSMYGKSGKQTFHEQWKDQFGPNAAVLQVKKTE